MWEKFTMLLVIKKYFSTVDTFCNSFGCHLVYQLLNITSKIETKDQ